MKYINTALNVSGRVKKISTNGDEKQLIYITWPYPSHLCSTDTLANPNTSISKFIFK